MAGKEGLWRTLKKGFVRGTGWALGATFGFAIIVAVLGFLLQVLGGLPVVGNWFAQIIEATNKAIEARKALGR